MIDTLRQLLYRLLVIAVVAPVWIIGWADANEDELDRSWWPAKDPAYVQGTFRKIMLAEPPADPHDPAGFGRHASVSHLVD